MVEYRLYCLDGTGRISLADTIIAAGDQDAVTKAHAMKRYSLKCEVWQGRRLVSTLDMRDLAN